MLKRKKSEIKERYYVDIWNRKKNIVLTLQTERNKREKKEKYINIENRKK
uniref:Uncharacterized protein n=1 Tax=Arion vulgaris TaxID=1028688 RepID=A0A0B7A649_9EUPU